ncbi:MAG: hypothetical protein K2X06_10085 [Burkholderiales bacterium]|nr:hypothetical protein [Burkholderiales bacterium]
MELTGNLPNAQYRRFESFREYEEIIDRMIPMTQSIIRVFDKAPGRAWNSTVRIELLRQFLLANRANRLLILLHDTRPLITESPRLVSLAQQFTHACTIRETLRAAKHAADPFVIFDGSHYVHRFHYNHMRAAQGTHDAAGAQQLIERFSEIQDCSGPPLAANVTGL